jgi:hypothetical protein
MVFSLKKTLCRAEFWFNHLAQRPQQARAVGDRVEAERYCPLASSNMVESHPILIHFVR